ncbi:MAG: M48 family metallopeptidase [Puniceicoccales bacterium]|jgi:STE24 endopeptidase|nr:M48 family metallopeptidase [Puniceicoccales bacterium]
MTLLNSILLILLLVRVICETVLRKLNASYTQNNTKISEQCGNFMDTKTLQRTIAYTLAKNQFALLHLYYEALLMICILFSGLIPWFLNQHNLLLSSIFKQSCTLFLWVTGFGLCFLPLDYFHQFSLEKSFGFNRSTKQLWISDQAKSIVINACIHIPIFALLFYCIQTFPQTWWILGTLGSFVLQITLMWLYPKLILPLFNKLTPLEDGSLKAKLDALAQKAGFKAAAIQVLDSSKRSSHANAYCSSLGRIQRIVLYDTLLKDFTDEEIEAILAHEIGHYKRKHILKMIAFSTFSTLVGLKACDMLLQNNWLNFQLEIPMATTPLPLLTLLCICMPLFTYWFHPINNYVSRRYEYEADAFAKKQSPMCAFHLIQALKKLHKKNLSNLSPHPWFSAFHYSHPTFFEREQHLSR